MQDLGISQGMCMSLATNFRESDKLVAETTDQFKLFTPRRVPGAALVGQSANRVPQPVFG